MPVQLVVGAGHIDRIIANADDLLLRYRRDTGYQYLDFKSHIPTTILAPEDLAVTLLVNSQAGWLAFRSLQENGTRVDLACLPEKPLEQTNGEERQQIAALIAAIARWPGFKASLATKVLHKKRPELVPILDNQAIFGAYMNADWPQRPARVDSIREEGRILQALDWIAFDLTRPENASAWEALRIFEPNRTRIQLFDSIWWIHFRTTQPVR